MVKLYSYNRIEDVVMNYDDWSVPRERWNMWNLSMFQLKPCSHGLWRVRSEGRHGTTVRSEKKHVRAKDRWPYQFQTCQHSVSWNGFSKLLIVPGTLHRKEEQRYLEVRIDKVRASISATRNIRCCFCRLSSKLPENDVTRSGKEHVLGILTCGWLWMTPRRLRFLAWFRPWYICTMFQDWFQHRVYETSGPCLRVPQSCSDSAAKYNPYEWLND